ncbi:MAG: uracil-DNA glycosylase [Sphingomonas fennica]
MFVSDDQALSALDWWSLAGVDTLVDEAPRDWLAPPRPRAPAAAAAPPPPAALPDTLDAFRRWWLESPDLPGPPATRLAPAGQAGARLMILIDCPDREDVAAGRLLSGAAAGLFDRLLAAIGETRESVYLAAFWPSRAGAGRLPAGRMAEIARHHIGLVAPRRLLLMGKAPAEALTAADAAAARGTLHSVAGVPTVATFAPAALIGQPALKALVWADLLSLTEER